MGKMFLRFALSGTGIGAVGPLVVSGDSAITIGLIVAIGIPLLIGTWKIAVAMTRLQSNFESLSFRITDLHDRLEKLERRR